MSDGMIVIFDEDFTMEDNRALVFPVLSIIIGVFVLSLRNAQGGSMVNSSSIHG